MAKEEGIELEGTVTDNQRDTFLVEVTLEGGKKSTVQARLSGKMRLNNIRVVPGDRVKVEVSPYDFEKGRITFRMKG